MSKTGKSLKLKNCPWQAVTLPYLICSVTLGYEISSPKISEPFRFDPTFQYGQFSNMSSSKSKPDKVMQFKFYWKITSNAFFDCPESNRKWMKFYEFRWINPRMNLDYFWTTFIPKFLPEMHRKRSVLVDLELFLYFYHYQIWFRPFLQDFFVGNSTGNCPKMDRKRSFWIDLELLLHIHPCAIWFCDRWWDSLDRKRILRPIFVI